jgi:hypothetical protein
MIGHAKHQPATVVRSNTVKRFVASALPTSVVILLAAFSARAQTLIAALRRATFGDGNWISYDRQYLKFDGSKYKCSKGC